jgi:hypothetical protein
MPGTAGYTNVGNARVRTDGADDRETSRIFIKQPPGGVFDVTDHNDDQVYTRDGDGALVVAPVAEFAVSVNISPTVHGFIGAYVSESGTSTAVETVIDDILNP